MAAESSSRQTSNDPTESTIDELIRDIFAEPGTSSESSGRDMAATAALFEQAFGHGRGKSRAGILEKMLLAEAFAAELADALAPALADRLAPMLMKTLEQPMAEQAPSKKPASSARSSGPGRKNS